jgi:hypothetical protein
MAHDPNIIRHKERTKPFQIAIGDEQTVEAVSQHIEKFIGPIDMVFHEIISDLVHLDVYHVKPSKKLDANVLITSGVSDEPMTTPDGYPGPTRIELCAFLPPDWRMPNDAETKAGESVSERFYWPVRWLKNLGRLPHEYETFLGDGHTIPNGDPPEPFADNVDFCCMYVGLPYMMPPEFFKLELPDREICFFSVLPLFKEEVDLKLRKGGDALEKSFEKHGLDMLEMFNAGRANAGKKKFLGLF